MRFGLICEIGFNRAMHHESIRLKSSPIALIKDLLMLIYTTRSYAHYWDELKDYQPASVCHCGSVKDRVNCHSQECVMQFFMGLNDSYAQVCAQILLIDPLPSIAKVFSLVVKEEKQRSITSYGVDNSFVSNASTVVGTARKFSN